MSDEGYRESTGPVVLGRAALDGLLEAIRRRGFRLVGPVLSNGAICYGDISSAADLPAGWTDEQEPAAYRLRKRDDQALFGYNVGPQSWKKYLFPASSRLGAADNAAATSHEVRTCRHRRGDGGARTGAGHAGRLQRSARNARGPDRARQLASNDRSR